MSRQRTICDRAFWHSPAMDRANCTTEDKVGLFHLLTSTDSNVIGAYAVMPRIAGAQIGWTPDQWLNVMERLTAADLALYDPERMFVWVKVWWEHNKTSQVMGPKLRRRTLEQLRLLPEPWVDPYLCDFRARLEQVHRDALDQAIAEIPVVGLGAPQIPHSYGIDTVSNLSRLNSNTNSISKVTPTLHVPARASVDNLNVPLEHRAAVEIGISKAQTAGVAKVDPQSVRDEMAKRYKSTRPPRDPAAYAFCLAQQMSEAKQETRRADPSAEELAEWTWRCFCWPTDSPSNFIRIMERGLFEHLFLEGEEWRRGHAHLDRSDFLQPLREGVLQEIESSMFAEISERVAA